MACWALTPAPVAAHGILLLLLLLLLLPRDVGRDLCDESGRLLWPPRCAPRLCHCDAGSGQQAQGGAGSQHCPGRRLQGGREGSKGRGCETQLAGTGCGPPPISGFPPIVESRCCSPGAGGRRRPPLPPPPAPLTAPRPTPPAARPGAGCGLPPHLTAAPRPTPPAARPGALQPRRTAPPAPAPARCGGPAAGARGAEEGRGEEGGG